MTDLEIAGEALDRAKAEKRDETELPAPSAPMAVAREIDRLHFTHTSGARTLRHWRGAWWRWEQSHWHEIEDREALAFLYTITENATYISGDDVKPWDPSKSKIANLLEAHAAISHLPEVVDQPSWLDDRDCGEIVATGNGLLDVEHRELLDHDPLFFNQTAVPFDYAPEAPAPAQWLRFLDQLWPEDPASIAALQEWFGYIVSGRLDLHKILLLIGPTRAGKGVIARVLGAMIGRQNVAGPTLSSLAGEFGLKPLLGCPLAVISDARMGKRDTSTVVERLLSISGEDVITVNRKYKDQWTGKLPSRFMVLSNELPELGDASAALAGRFVVLLLKRSWYDQEDPELTDKLITELPGILNWALDGLERLSEEGHFTRPPASEAAITQLRDLASPVGAFVRDRLEIDPTHVTNVDDVYASWKDWAEDNGHRQKTRQTLGRDLHAQIPQLDVVWRGPMGDQHRCYGGIALKAAALAEEARP